jgi:hypothetical protein
MQNEILASSSTNIKLDKSQIRKMMFLMNALEQGWSLKKLNNSYIFTKKHENRKEIFQENYLENFLLSNFSGELLDKID